MDESGWLELRLSSLSGLIFRLGAKTSSDVELIDKEGQGLSIEKGVLGDQGRGRRSKRSKR